MLAHPYTKRKHNVRWPAMAQRKLNGCRCLAHMDEDSQVTLYSRKGVVFKGLDHITDDLLNIMQPNTLIDGELYNHNLSFQEIMKRVRRTKNMNDKSVDIQYWVYDIVSDSEFSARHDVLSDLLSEDTHLIRRLHTDTIHSEEDLFALHKEHVEQGYEGTMIRNMHGLYKQNHRSADLQKFKDFQDEEFEIVGANTGVGKEAGACIFVCKTKGGKTFDVRPRGTLEERREWYNNIDEFIGQPLTVRFQEYSDDEIPIFPVGVDVRDDWN